MNACSQSMNFTPLLTQFPVHEFLQQKPACTRMPKALRVDTTQSGAMPWEIAPRCLQAASAVRWSDS